jgi:hypothetical protein
MSIYPSPQTVLAASSTLVKISQRKLELEDLMRENIRSGRKANFYITENSFIDHYAKTVGPMCTVVYNVLERYMNSETRSTWVGTAKIAEVVGATQRTVQRNLKTLEEFKLIRILKTASATTYVVLPVPARPKETTIPLFDLVDEQDILWKGDTAVAEATLESFATTEPSHHTTEASQPRDTGDTANKEEQNLFNKTYEQENFKIKQTAKRIIKILDLPDNLLSAAIAAVAVKVKQTRLSMDGIVQRITTDANLAERMNGVSHHKFLEDFLAQTCAQEILDSLSLPVTNSLISTVTAAVKAEVKHTGLSVEEAAGFITSAATEDRDKGISIDRFYFENVKWRSNARLNKAEKRKLDNLEANARAKRRLRERFGVS